MPKVVTVASNARFHPLWEELQNMLGQVLSNAHADKGNIRAEVRKAQLILGDFLDLYPVESIKE